MNRQIFNPDRFLAFWSFIPRAALGSLCRGLFRLRRFHRLVACLLKMTDIVLKEGRVLKGSDKRRSMLLELLFEVSQGIRLNRVILPKLQVAVDRQNRQGKVSQKKQSGPKKKARRNPK